MPHRPSNAAHTIISGTSIIVFTQVLSALLSFVTYRIIQSTFTKEENGEFFWIQQVGAFVMTCFVEAGMTTIATGIAVREPENEAAIISTLFKLRFVLWCAGTFILMALCFWYGWDLTIPMMLWAVHLFLSGKIALLRSVLEIRRRARSNQLLPSLAMLLDSVLLVVLVWMDARHLTTLTVMGWLVLSALPGFVWMLLLDKNWHILRAPFEVPWAKALWQASMPVFVVVLLQQGHTIADTMVLDYFGTKIDVGIYAAAYRLVAPTLVFVVALATAMFPTIAAFSVGDVERSRSYILQGVKLVVLFAIGFAMTASAALPWLIHLSSGALYMDNQKEFFFFVWAIVPSFVVTFLLTINTAISWQRRNYSIFGTLFLTTIVADFILIPPYHVIGAIASKALACTLAAAIAFKVLAEYCGTKAVVNLIMRSLLLIGGAIGEALFLPTIASTLACFLLTIPIFVLLVIVTGFVGKREIDIARSFVRSIRTQS